MNRRLAVDTLAEKLIETAIPTSYKYLLWSSGTNTSLFDSGYEKKKPKKNQKYLIYEEQKKIEQGLNDIWSIIEPDEWKKKTLSYIQPQFIKAKESLTRKVHEFLAAKNALLGEVTAVTKLVQNEIWPKFWPTDVAKGMLWAESKKHEKELSVELLFGIHRPTELSGGIMAMGEKCKPDPMAATPTGYYR